MAASVGGHAHSSSAQAECVAAIKARIAQIRTRTAQVEAEIEQRLSERVQLRGTLADAEAALGAAVHTPVTGGVDPTEWLPNELLLLIFAHLTFARSSAAVCRRWQVLFQELKVEAPLIRHRWREHNSGTRNSIHLRGHTNGVRAIAIGHGNKLYSASQDMTIRVWSMEDGRCIQVLTGHTAYVLGLAVGIDGTLYSSSSDTTLKAWSGVYGSHIETLRGHEAAVRCVVVTRGAMVFSGSRDTTIKAWKRGLASSTCIRTLVGHAAVVNALALNPDHNTLYSGSDDTTVRVWSVRDGIHLRTLVHTTQVYSVVAGDNDLVFSGVVGADNTIQVWRASDGRLLHTHGHHTDTVLCLARGVDGTVLSGGGRADKTVQMWCGQTGKHLGAVNLDGRADAIAMAPKGELYIGERDCNSVTVLP